MFRTRKNFLFLLPLFFLLPSIALADNLLEKRDFFVDPDYDFQKREKVTAVLQRVTDKLYFYIDDSWWGNLDIEKRKAVNVAIDNLSQEFENKIYPVLTSTYGSEPNPGIDNDARITILIHPMIETAAGYFNPNNEFPKIQNPSSNQREMFYLSSGNIAEPSSKSFFSHEFSHLISFNQKENIRGVSEDVWLNEARAEYAPTLLGYDNIYQGSNLQRRVDQFLKSPQDSITEWRGKGSDYGVLNLFIQYLVDHYGVKILTDSLFSGKVGIDSLNYALKKNGFEKNFSDIFTDWTIAIVVNDCKVSANYCYLNENLKGFRITPYIYYLPATGQESTLSVGYLTKEWAGNWQKVVSGKKALKLDFTGDGKVNFKVPYIVDDSQGKRIGFLTLDNFQKGTLYIANNEITSLTIIPSAQSKTAGFAKEEPSYQFSWSVKNEEIENEALIKSLQEKIVFLQAEIARVQAQIALILYQRGGEPSCSKITRNLYYGLMNNQEVICLQMFLKRQGMYPEGAANGNFLAPTVAAVIRFQEKYASDILFPSGLSKGTGFVGPATRLKINSMF